MISCVLWLLVSLGIIECFQWMCRADSAAVAITTTDLVRKSVAVESQVHETFLQITLCIP